MLLITWCWDMIKQSSGIPDHQHSRMELGCIWLHNSFITYIEGTLVHFLKLNISVPSVMVLNDLHQLQLHKVQKRVLSRFDECCKVGRHKVETASVAYSAAMAAYFLWCHLFYLSTIWMQGSKEDTMIRWAVEELKSVLYYESPLPLLALWLFIFLLLSSCLISMVLYFPFIVLLLVICYVYI